MNNNYYDISKPLHPYTFSAPAMPGTLPPDNALRADLPFAFAGDGTPVKANVPAPFAGLWPCASGGEWTLLDDHRGEKGFLHGEAYTIREVGPYPAGWSMEAPPAPEPTPEEQQAAFTAAIQERLDSFAQTRGYDGIMSAATYVGSCVPKFQLEGCYAIEVRDATWAAAYAVLDAVLAGERAMPTIEEVFAELPELAWPAVAGGGTDAAAGV